jgi:hypothetical protein
LPDEGRPILDYATPESRPIARLPIARLPFPWKMLLLAAVASTLLVVVPPSERGPSLRLDRGTVLEHSFRFIMGPAPWIATVALTVRHVRKARGKETPAKPWERLWPKLVFVVLAGGIVFAFKSAECPHARYAAIGPYGWVTGGRPCNNGVDWMAPTILRWTGIAE